MTAENIAHASDITRNEAQLTPQPSLPASKRRRTSGNPSSRGVANLTPEQLARKRANDREAQRAIRERTKAQIDNLNQRIRELESQQPYHDLQIVLREKEVIQAENEDIRKRLASVISIIQPILRASGGLNELAAAAERSPLPLPHEPASRVPDTQTFPSDPRLQDTVPTHSSNLPSIPSQDDPGSNRQWQFPGDAPTSHVRHWQATSPHPQFEQPRPPVHNDMPMDERLGVEYILDNGQRGIVDGLPPSGGPLIGQHAPREMVPHLLLPQTVPATCTLDAIMLEFLHERQARATEGLPSKVLVGPAYPNFAALVYPDRTIEAHPLSKLFIGILRTFPDISGLPEQVAVVYFMFLLMRWQIEPTQENYDRLPEWVTPRACQLFTKHPAWMDYIPWPRLRDKCVSTRPNIPFDNFFIPFTTTLSVNWPHEPRDCLLYVEKSRSSSLPTSLPPSYSTGAHVGSARPATPGPTPGTPGPVSGWPGNEDEQWQINPDFECHIRDLNNWSLGPAFRAHFPEYADHVRIREA
ncbi:hypothetical protein GQ43DRAFT_480757 [Delitschia confertaspora ATCC 74209]|uniref:BZIP transcription factor n=1 Tax=Delitschia confertaspora ATCC 74209 TaxID=1513339 RepID=A0A9P4JQF4_9PLEO|nr:hypothetical protein GQ43DRAFT_480757 [Delitschia confertaspora ATCC 74209]